MDTSRLDAALYEAVLAGDVETIQQLIDRGANVHARDDQGWTVLHKAAIACDPDVVQLLLEKGADVNAMTQYRSTPLFLACIVDDKSSRRDTIQLLLSRPDIDVKLGNDIGHTPLNRTILQGHTGLAQQLVKKGADVNAKDICGQTALHYAVRAGSFEIVQTLLSLRSVLDGIDTLTKEAGGGRSPLHMAVAERKTVIARYLIYKGANPYVKTGVAYSLYKKPHTILDIASSMDKRGTYRRVIQGIMDEAIRERAHAELMLKNLRLRSPLPRGVVDRVQRFLDYTT